MWALCVNTGRDVWGEECDIGHGKGQYERRVLRFIWSVQSVHGVVGRTGSGT